MDTKINSVIDLDQDLVNTIVSDKPLITEVLSSEEETTNNSTNEEKSNNTVETYVNKMVEDKIESISNKTNIFGIGTVVTVKDFIIEVVGLEGVAFNEKVKISDKGIGYVVQMKPNRVSIAILEKSQKIFGTINS